jgi:methionyl-tRNA formyltransferase
MLRIVFFGTPEFAVRSLDALLASRHEVVGVVTQPDRPRGRGQRVSPSPVKTTAEAAGLPVWQPDKLRDEQFLDALRDLSPDLGVVAAYGRLLPEPLLALPGLGLINVHASLLPRHRGASPLQHAILAGDSETGVTIMRVVKALDAGGMLARRATPIDPDETAGVLEARLAELGAALLVETLDPLERGDVIETPQDESQVTYAGRLTKLDGLIGWDASARAIHDRVRAFAPWPHAFTFLDGTRYVVHETRPFDSAAAAWKSTGAGSEPSGATSAAPGVVLAGPRGHLLVAAANRTIVEILRLQEEGRRIVSARELLAGRPIPPGARFSSHEPA